MKNDAVSNSLIFFLFVFAMSALAVHYSNISTAHRRASRDAKLPFDIIQALFRSRRPANLPNKNGDMIQAIDGRHLQN